MKIGILCYPTFGGSGVVATELGLGLAKKGHKIHFITYKRPARLPQFHQNIYFHEVGDVDYPLFQYPPYDTALCSKVVGVAQYEGLDLLHVHYAIPHSTVAYMAKKILLQQGIYIPVITTLHGTDITLVGKEASFQSVVEFGLNKSDGITAVSEFLRTATLENFQVDRDIRVIYNFVDLEKFKHSNKDHFKKAIAPDGEKIISHISNFRKVKRAEDVILTFAGIRKQVPSKLLMIGDGPERSRLERMCREMGICGDIRFLGKQSAIQELLSISDLFLLPSANESFGLAALEAMACEVPVISSNAGGLSEVNIHGDTGYICAIGDIKQMAKYGVEMLTNPGLHAQLKDGAYKQAQRFNIDHILPQYENYYEEVIKDARARKPEIAEPLYKSPN